MATSTPSGVYFITTEETSTPSYFITTVTSTPTVFYTIPNVIPVTTTFTPAPTCQSPYLTMLSSPGYQIWFAEPVPVPATTASACYPSEWIEYYSSRGTSSIVPVVSPLICPQGWEAVESWSSSYIACCPSSYQLHNPDVLVDNTRSAYGGTCYSDLSSGQTLTVTGYDTASVTATFTWVASVTNAQVYAHPIDGYQEILATQTSSSSHIATSTPVATSSVSESPSPIPSPHPALSGGAIAGLVIASVLGAVFLGVGAALLYWRRRKALNNGQIETLPHDQVPPYYSERPDNAPDMLQVQHKRASSNVAELPGDQQVHELGSARVIAELPENYSHISNSDKGHSDLSGSTQV
ncbi:hypothetical protein ABEF92_008281 [Exophiala dermatitidis]|uniref:Uncharacterized protein n=1 Tax=Exophiala dermatitidis (strain ATCC 34100 / CBS 525.76 / NIH/UT8656) TaxID=858893 RepID=H6BS73_EXODN|nr:uncharacterized protein HMPREF1120_02304 [Exophiala dermatitidis NIH/UT8656]EHY54128.1 hypothetical protein HMPREF1120_02304 [Exophiala dermatitidis NIH/UT8656]